MREWLVKFRETKGLTQKGVASQCGISRSFYADIEHGTRNPKVATAKVIGDTLGFDWTIFFEVNGRKSRQKQVRSA